MKNHFRGFWVVEFKYGIKLALFAQISIGTARAARYKVIWEYLKYLNEYICQSDVIFELSVPFSLLIWNLRCELCGMIKISAHWGIHNLTCENIVPSALNARF